MEAKYYIYFYYEPDRAEPFYVGKGFGNRAWHHLRPNHLRMHDLFHNKLRQMLADGYVPEIQIQDEDLTESEALHLERVYIQKFGRIELGAGPLFNMSDGGDGTSGNIVSQETKSKIAAALRGTKHSKERRENQSKAKDWKKTPIIAYWVGLDIVYKEYPSLSSVRLDGFDHRTIHRALNKKIPTAYGCTWEYKKI